MEQQQHANRLEVSPDELYALIGQLTVETRLLRAALARQTARHNGEAAKPVLAWETVEPSAGGGG